MTRDETVQQRILWAAEYINKARPILREMLHGGEIVRVEGKAEEVCKTLDITCGTDYIYVYPERNHAWGMACRVQTYDKWNFTVRYKTASGCKTELDKRRYAIAKRGIYPYLTMQMFVDDNLKRIRRIGIIKTEDLMDAVDNGLYTVGTVNKDRAYGRNEFLIVEWRDLVRAGYKMQQREVIA